MKKTQQLWLPLGAADCSWDQFYAFVCFVVEPWHFRRVSICSAGAKSRNYLNASCDDEPDSLVVKYNRCIFFGWREMQRHSFAVAFSYGGVSKSAPSPLLRKWDRLASASPFCAIIWDHYFICENGSPLKLHSEAVQRFTTSHQHPLSWLHLWASCFTATWCFEWGCIMLLEGEGHASVKELQISGARFKLLSADEWWSALPAPPHIAG